MCRSTLVDNEQLQRNAQLTPCYLAVPELLVYCSY